jgi:hypothetical protein
MEPQGQACEYLLLRAGLPEDVEGTASGTTSSPASALARTRLNVVPEEARRRWLQEASTVSTGGHPLA